jgi:hypothetical protein
LVSCQTSPLYFLTLEIQMINWGCYYLATIHSLIKLIKAWLILSLNSFLMLNIF